MQSPGYGTITATLTTSETVLIGTATVQGMQLEGTVIGPQGGEVAASDGVVTVTVRIPPNAITGTMLMTVTKLFAPSHALPEGKVDMGSWTVIATDLHGISIRQFLQPLEMRLPMQTDDMDGMNLDWASFRGWYWDESAEQWVVINDSYLDPGARWSPTQTLVFFTNHLTDFAVFASPIASVPDPTFSLFIPMVSR